MSRFLAISRSFSMRLRREMTMLRRSVSILSTLARTSRPMYSPMSPGRRTSTWEAGRNTGTPMSTSRPPLILRITRPSTTSPSRVVSMIRCQFSMRSALRLLSSTIPVSSSIFSKSTWTLSPTFSSAALSNSSRAIRPSLLSPTSTTTSSPAKPMTLPSRIEPGVNCPTCLESRSSIPPLALAPKACESSAAASSSPMPRDAIRFSSIMWKCSRRPQMRWPNQSAQPCRSERHRSRLDPTRRFLAEGSCGPVHPE